jgi:hypothetical protein
MTFRPEDLGRLRKVFAGKGLLVSGGLSSPVEQFCCYSVYNFLKTSKNEKVIWIAADDSYEKVQKIFADYGYNLKPYLDRFLFIDLISLKSGAEVKESDKVKYVQDPGNLTELAMAVSEHMETGKVSMIVMYLMNSLLLYNELPRALEFARILVARAFEKKFVFIGAAIEGEHDEKAHIGIRLAMDALLKVEENHLHVIGAKDMDSFSYSFEKDGLKAERAKEKFDRAKMLG